jgi:hypothetical protein
LTERFEEVVSAAFPTEAGGIFMRTLLGVLVFAVAAMGCGPTEDIDARDVATSKSALTNDGYWLGQSTGKLYSDNSPANWEGVTSEHIWWAAYNQTVWTTNNPKRWSIIDVTGWENWYGLCGAEARPRYGADSSEAWCSEYAQWSLRSAGLRNIRYCALKVLGVCLDYEYLNEANSVNDLVNLFSKNGGWVNEWNITTGTIQPGDYVALRGSAGYRGHSGMVMAISSDYRWLWTSEGNVGNCVQFMRRDLFVNGVLNPDINGIGKSNVAF